MPQTDRSWFQKAVVDPLLRMIRKDPENPEDPYAYVTAPKIPRPPHLTAKAAAELDD